MPFRLLCLFFLALIGCSSDLDGERSVVDGLGRTLHIPSKIQRVAPLAPSITDLLFASGAGSTIAGVSTVDDHTPELDSLPRYSLIPMDLEAIVALDIDLIIASEQVNTLRDADAFEALGISVYFVFIDSLSDIAQSIRELGHLLGTSEIANNRANELEDSLSLLKSLTETITDRADLLFLIEHTTLYAFGDGSYIHDMIDLAGGYSLTQDISTRFPILTDEFVLTSQPEVIAGTFGSQINSSKILEAHPTWDIVPAVRSGRIYGFDNANYQRPGPRLVRGAWDLAEKLHPDIVKPHD